MAKREKIITFTSDFGTSDGYVGAVKGVILSICPSAMIVDISHDIPPQDVETAAWCLMNAVPFFPEGTIHLAVVDPEVGSERLPIVIESASNHIFVGPDNGIFYLAIGQKRPLRVWTINPESIESPVEIISSTFHGRDIFAPAAAMIANGVDIDEIGTKMNPRAIQRLEIDATFQVDDNTVRGKVLHIDRFGNLVTSIPNNFADKILDGEIERYPVRAPVPNFSSIKKGQVNFIQGSTGFIEIASFRNSAVWLTGARKGSFVVARLKRGKE